MQGKMVTPGAYCDIYTSYELTAINNVTIHSGIHTFILLAYASEQIHLPHCICMSHHTATVIYI